MENAANAEFCSNRSCGAFLGWQGADPGPAPTAPAPRPTPPAPQAQVPTAPAPRPAANLGGPTQRVLARLESDHGRVEPGSACQFGLVVRNAGTVVEQFVIAVGGVPSSWITVDPPLVNLDVDAERRCVITVRPPRVATTTAGPAPMTVTVTSSVDQAAVARVDAVVDIEGFTTLNSTLSPFESEGKRAGEHQLIVSNDGNAQTHVNFTATDPTDKLRIAFDPPTAALQPAQQAYVRVLATPRRRVWFGNPKRHQFSVGVTPPSGEGTQLNASMNQLARFPGWVPKAAIAVFVVVLALGIPLTIRALNNRDKNKPVELSSVIGQTFDQASSQIQNLGLKAERAGEVSGGVRDTVFAQDPPAGTKVPKNTVVKLTIALGPGRAAIADVQAFSAADATRTLEALKLVVTTNPTPITNRDVAEGMVVRTNPPAGTEVDAGSKVELVISDGPMPKPLPPTVGTKVDDAIKTLNAAGFAVSGTTNKKISDATQMGLVAECKVTDTTNVARACGPREKESSTIALTVNVMNTAPATVPNLTNKTQAAAQQALEAISLRMGTITKKPSTAVASGSVIETKPAANAQADRGSAVDIVISGGPPVTVPSLNGLTIGAAKTKLTSLGLTGSPGVCRDTESVFNQTPAANAQVSKGDTVSLGCNRCTLQICVPVRSVLLNDLIIAGK
ncbi:MAG TPA: PASTA domain-containing protein [Acidimicrobiales bacterium]|jgi:serine/threonine-protein kinase|nr:PASTA domain-containing protein [Acidimicrobiales bacterium]